MINIYSLVCLFWRSSAYYHLGAAKIDVWYSMWVPARRYVNEWMQFHRAAGCNCETARFGSSLSAAINNG